MANKTKAPGLNRLFETIEARKSADPKSSYTAKLYARGTEKIAQKVGEEAVELALAAVKKDREEVIAESADLLYHVLVLWADAGVTPADVYAMLAKREGMSGIDEKAARKKD
ncbi:MAG: phosphoribosyl-ATP diphosphatase [Alphaproteobacteria bacterium]|nr:MAG: phosphoribosyl-ATP diphosphatase [Alphaproteobacteria bacterium]